MKRFIAGESYESCLVPKHIGYLMKVKKGFYDLTEARRLAYETDQENKRLKEENIAVPEFIDQGIVNALSDLKVRFIKQFLREELTRGE